MIQKDAAINQPVGSHYTDRQAIYTTKQYLYEILREIYPLREAIFLCIGTDRATGDALGPLVGTKVKQLCPHATIYGTLEHPVHALNLSETTDQIYENHLDPFIFAVDACLGHVQRIGFVNLSSGGIQPGSALNKNLPAVGDYHLTGTVNVGGFCESMILQSTRLHLVYSMANTIAYIIASACFLLHRENSTSPRLLANGN